MGEWGLCRDCKWWQIEPDAHVELQTVGEGAREWLGIAQAFAGPPGPGRAPRSR